MMGVTLNAGGSLGWFRDALCPGVKFDQLTREANATPAGAEGLHFLPYLSGERTPHLDPLARGALIGLTPKHNRGHIARAVLEGVTLSLRDSLALMQDLDVPIRTIRASGGGSKSPFWRQMQADVFGKPVTTMAADEGPAYGAALLAAVGAGHYKNVTEACQATVKTSSQIKPIAKNRRVYDKTFPVFQALYTALKDEFPKLKG